MNWKQRTVARTLVAGSVIVAALVGPGPAGAATGVERELDQVRATQEALYFDLSGIKANRIVRAEARLRLAHRRLHRRLDRRFAGRPAAKRRVHRRVHRRARNGSPRELRLRHVRTAARTGSDLRVKRPPWANKGGKVKVVTDSPEREDEPPPEDPPPSGGGGGECPKFGPYRAFNWPAACWRPYADSSPFNRLVPANPRLMANSSAIVSRLAGWGRVQNLLAGHSGSSSDYWHPLYYSQPSDPLYTVRCLRWVSSCTVHGDQVRIPAAAKPAAGGDGHLAVIDQATGVEYDLWEVESKPAGGGTIEIAHGGKTSITGDGLGSNATAAHFGLAAGIIRGPEMLAGEIRHALFSQVKCSSGTAVYPAAPGTSGASCSRFGLSNQDAPPMGARLWLDMSEAQIAGLPVPAWKKTILRAMADYGVLIGDTMAGNGSWGVQAESGASYTSFGAKDPWTTVGERAGVGRYAGGYVFDIHSGVDWARHLRVLHPCVSQGSC